MNQITMSKTKSNYNTSIPQWQSNKMRNLITKRWQEVWAIVEAREKRKN